MFSVIDLTLYSIALARWPQENFDLMIKIMQTSLTQGHSCISFISCRQRNSDERKACEGPSEARCEVFKKGMLLHFLSLLMHRCPRPMGSSRSSVGYRSRRLPKASISCWSESLTPRQLTNS